ncbi:MAG: hypothetical protein Ta2A_06620 [Treponemataceae bacterium]|nr:MAG: hypothetical protein Ta2A_06620 [Treponemataceae bacterium]
MRAATMFSLRENIVMLVAPNAKSGIPAAFCNQNQTCEKLRS